MKSKLFSLIVSVLAAMCLCVYVMTVVNPDVYLPGNSDGRTSDRTIQRSNLESGEAE